MKDKLAFPSQQAYNNYDIIGGGLTKLEYFAGLAMQGLLSGAYSNISNSEELAKQYIYISKELIKQLENE